MNLPLDLKKKTNKQSLRSDLKQTLRILAVITILFLTSAIFLMTGPEAIELIESHASSENVQKSGLVLSEIRLPTPAPKMELISANTLPPKISAVSVIAYDVQTDKMLFEKNIHTKLAPASTTKIMTAVIGSEHFSSGDLLTVPAEAIVGGSTMGLVAGEQITFRSLLYGMMLNSGNDAAFTIAYNYPGGYSVFISKMNERVSELGLKDTHFDNPAGFDSPAHYSSAYDLLQIAKAAKSNAKLGRVFSTKETSVASIDKSQIHILKNLNKLLNQDGVVGIKTGTTEMAGESFVGLVEKDGHNILTVMLNSPDRFGETKSLIDWIFNNYSWKIN